MLESDVRTGDNGSARVAFEPLAPGPHAVKASTARGGAGPLFLEVVDRSREMAEPSARPEVLEALAAATGGELRPLDGDSGALPLSGHREERVESVSILPLWRTWWAWWAWSIVAGLLCAEWWLRRRWGLA